MSLTIQESPTLVTVQPDCSVQVVTAGTQGPAGAQGATGATGPAGLNWRGDYDNATAYAVDDAVAYNGSSYVCTAASTGNLPTDTNYWDVLAAKGDAGSGGGGSGDTLAATYDPAARAEQVLTVSDLLDEDTFASDSATKAPSQQSTKTYVDAGLAGKAAASHTHDAGDVVSGTLADARIAESSVTQHEGALTHDNLSGAGSNTHAQIDTHIADVGKHREINDAGSATTDLWSADKIATELAGKSATGHGHAIGDVTGLQTALDSKAASAHTHTLADVTDSGALAALDTVGTSEIDNDAVTYAKLQNVSATDTLLGRATAGPGDVEEITCTAFARSLLDDADAANARATLGAVDASHTHAIADVTNLQSTLDGKAAASHAHAIGDVTSLQTALDGKAATSHTHGLDALTDVAVTAAAQNDILQHNGTSFVNTDEVQNLALLGVNMLATSTYKLSVKSSAVLLEHDGDDMQLVVRKNLAGDTASTLFQAGTSGRAEMGLIGNNDFQLRTSANGSTWNTVFTALQDGRISVGGTSSFVTRYGTSGTEPQLQIVSTGSAASYFMGRFSNNPYPGRIFLGKSRGATIGAHGAVQAYDELGAFSFAGSDGTKMCEGARLIAAVSGTPGSHYTPTHLDFHTSDGTNSPARNFSVKDDGALGMGTSRDTVISSDRHFQLRSYTVATLPSASNAGEMIYVSDETGGAVPAFADGTNWRRMTDRAVVA